MVLVAALLLAVQPIVALQAYGSVRPEDIAIAKSAAESLYNVRVMVLAARPLPGAAYYAPRERYRAEKLLTDLSLHKPSGSLKIIGLSPKDISTEAHGVKDWGVFGLGNLSGDACVVSPYRLGRGNVSASEFRVRLSNDIRHELGHTFGLPHCPTPGCLMADAAGSIKSITGSLSPLCGICRAKINKDLLR